MFVTNLCYGSTIVAHHCMDIVLVIPTHCGRFKTLMHNLAHTTLHKKWHHQKCN